LAKFLKFVIVICISAWLLLITYDYVKDIYKAYQYELTNTDTTAGTDVVVTIPSGASAKKVAKILKKKGLIEFETAFVSRLQDSEYRGKLKAGTYTLNTGMNTLEMMEVLSPKQAANEPIDTLVIPEGFTVDMIATRCQKKGICSKQEFINACNTITSKDFWFLSDVPTGANVRYLVEGYLFPATYNIYETTTAESLVRDMLQAFSDYYKDEYKSQAEELGLNTYQVVTMAAMIERECKVDEERALIASVINNRLAKDMLLQIDSTVVYPLSSGMYDRKSVSYNDLETDSLYNTYKYKGLPVGPICNPGLACIKAVLYPEETDYLYYHVDDAEKGTHIFTETFEEHIETQ